MQIGELNNNISRRLAEIVASGQPELITYHRWNQPYAKVASVELFDDLIEAAGERGQDVLKRHREAAEQQKQENAA